MPKRSALYPAGYGAYSGGVGTLGQAQGNVLLPPSAQARFGLDWTSASTWAWTYFLGAVAFLFWVYFAHGGRRGGAL